MNSKVYQILRWMRKDMGNYWNVIGIASTLANAKTLCDLDAGKPLAWMAGTVNSEGYRYIQRDVSDKYQLCEVSLDVVYGGSEHEIRLPETEAQS